MINGLDIPYKKFQGNGLTLPGTIKGKGCDVKKQIKKGKRLAILK